MTPPAHGMGGSHDRHHKTVSISVRRLHYDEPRSRRILGLYPVTTFQAVLCTLTVRNVVAATLDPVDVRSPRGVPFDYAALSGSKLELWFATGKITMELSAWEPITLEDRGPPSPEIGHAYWGYAPQAFEAMAADLRARRSDA
jgi:hypothetical protein